MIPHTMLRRRFEQERGYWIRRELRTEWVSGVIYGLKLASELIDALWAYVQVKARADKNYLPMCFDKCIKESKRKPA